MGRSCPLGAGAGVVWSLAILAARVGAEDVTDDLEERPDRDRKSVTRK